MSEQKKILFAICSNRRYIPTYFLTALFRLYNYTIKYHQVAVCVIQDFDLTSMRNIAARIAMRDKFDYVFMMDDDQIYPDDTIIKLVSADKDLITGTCRQRQPPHYPTQYVDPWAKEFKAESNRIFTKETDKDVMEIGGSGTGGLLIKTEIFTKLKEPYFMVEYKDDGSSLVGEDLYFCRKAKLAGFRYYLDPTVHYQHEIQGFVSANGMTELK